MKIHVRPRCPEDKNIKRSYAVSDGMDLLASGKCWGTLAEVRAHAASIIPKGRGMFDYSTGHRRMKK